MDELRHLFLTSEIRRGQPDFYVLFADGQIYSIIRCMGLRYATRSRSIGSCRSSPEAVKDMV